jgi:hypothetical protein
MPGWLAIALEALSALALRFLGSPAPRPTASSPPSPSPPPEPEGESIRDAARAELARRRAADAAAVYETPEVKP